MVPRHPDPRLAAVIDFFEQLQPSDLQRIAQIYSADAFFKDPFNEVRGTVAIEGIFAHMFTSLDVPRFVVHEAMVQGDSAFLTWDFSFRLRRGPAGPQVIRGATQLRFAPDGRVAWHRDYWDAAEELYEKLPLLGVFMRWLKRRARS